MSNLRLPRHLEAIRISGFNVTDFLLLEATRYFSKQWSTFHPSNAQLAEMLGVGSTKAQESLKKLRDLNLITVKFNGSTRVDIVANDPMIDAMIEKGAFPDTREGLPESREGAPGIAGEGLPGSRDIIEQSVKKINQLKEKKTARGAARLDLIKELNLKAEELILGEEGLFGDEKPPEWRNALLGWIKDRIDPSRVQIFQPKKPSRVVNLPQISKLAAQANRWEKEIEANNGSAALLEVAIVESVEEARIQGWSSVHPEKEFERIFRQQIKVVDAKTDELVSYVVTSLGGNIFKDYSAKKIAAEKLRGKTMKEAQYHVGRLKDLRKKYKLTASLGTQISTLFDGQEAQASDLLDPDKLRQWKADRGDL
jgi:hypothetical protein